MALHDYGRAMRGPRPAGLDYQGSLSAIGVATVDIERRTNAARNARAKAAFEVAGVEFTMVISRACASLRPRQLNVRPASASKPKGAAKAIHGKAAKATERKR